MSIARSKEFQHTKTLLADFYTAAPFPNYNDIEDLSSLRKRVSEK